MAKQAEIIGRQAKEFKLYSLSGNEVNLSDYIGKPVLVEFWFPGCGFCIEAVPEVEKISEKYKLKGLVVLGIEISNASIERIHKFVNDYGVSIPILINGKGTSIAYSANSGPTFVLLDEAHKVVYRSSGLNNQELSTELDKLF